MVLPPRSIHLLNSAVTFSSAKYSDPHTAIGTYVPRRAGPASLQTPLRPASFMQGAGDQEVGKDVWGRGALNVPHAACTFVQWLSGEGPDNFLLAVSCGGEKRSLQEGGCTSLHLCSTDCPTAVAHCPSALVDCPEKTLVF